MYDRQAEITLRKQWFDPEVMRHPAKANLFMMLDIINYVSESGDTLLDPMAGTGTIMVAALSGRDVICLEIEQSYHDLQERNKHLMEQQPSYSGNIMLLFGNCMDFLPLPSVDHIIFSPPYADIMKREGSGETALSREVSGSREGFSQYFQSRGNVGRLPQFLYNHEMWKVYQGLWQSLKPGGSMTVILKEFVKSRKRVPLTTEMVRICTGIGFEVELWEKREALTGFTDIQASKGHNVVRDEDVVVFRRRS